MHWQFVDPVAFLYEFQDRIYHVHMKDSARQLDGRTGILASHLNVDARRFITVLFVVLVGAEISFVLADAIINVERLTELSPIRRFFNITREDGVASWFAVTQTWMLGLTAAFLYVVVRAGDAPRWRRVGWGILAVFLIYMAVDDGALFHERIGSSVDIH